MPVADITVATSVAPRDVARQRAAIETWRHHGMRVVSVNARHEIGLLRDALPGVELVDAGEPDQGQASRDLVYFDQLVAALKASESPVCVIANADIHLRADEGFARALGDAASNAFVLAHRIDMDRLDQEAGDIYRQGYDFLCCDRALLEVYPESPFRIGAPWWDLWAAIVPVLCGHEVKLLTDPVAIHLKHESGWKAEAEWQAYAIEFATRLVGLAGERHRLWPAGPADFEQDPWGAVSRIVTGETLSRIAVLSEKVGKDPSEQRSALTTTSTMFLLALGGAIPRIISTAAEEISFGAGRADG